MKIENSRLSALLLIVTVAAPMTASTPVQEHPVDAPSSTAISDSYTPDDPELHATIAALDRVFFAAFNECDQEISAAMLSEDIEFFHDQGGYTNSRQEILDATRENVCGKVTRTLLEGSIEVYPIPGYGAVQMGMHSFFNNQEPDAPSHPSKFVHVWKNDGSEWQITKVISLH